MERIITIFTDGSSRGNPGPGGFGAVIVFSCQFSVVREEKEKSDDICITEIGGREEHTTNNRMELRAAIEALSFSQTLPVRTDVRPGGHAKRFTLNAVRCTLYTDSRYLISGITKWLPAWQKRGWKTMDKKDVLNRDLWEKLGEVAEGKDIEWKYVGGHSGIAGNERCDEIATAFADLPAKVFKENLGGQEKLYSGPLESYPIKNILNFQGFALDREEGKTLENSRSRGAAYSYVSMVDGKILTHKNWDDCKKRVSGKSGALFKKALSEEDEKRLIRLWSK